MPASLLRFTDLSVKARQRYKLLLSCSAALLLTACGSTATKNGTPSAQQETGIHSEQSRLSADDLLSLAQQSSFDQAQIYRLKAAEILAQEGRSEAALNILSLIQTQRLPFKQQKLYVMLTARLSLEQGDGWQAMQALNNAGSNIYERLNGKDQQILTLYRARAYALMGYHESSAREYMTLARIQTGQSQSEAYAGLWNSLLNMSQEDIRLLLAEETDEEMQGWLDLARVRKEASANLDQFTTELNRWLEYWPTHPAVEFMPRDISFLDEISRNPITHIAVFLPQSGKLARAGNAIRDGIIASAIHNKTLGSQPPELSFFDSNKLSVNQLYSAAAEAGAQVAIGPLAKDKVTTLQQRSSLAMPTLALNYGTRSGRNNQELVQYAISVEDEASQAAQRAWQDGKKTALTLTPSNSWGNRALNAFKDNWTKQGGRIATSTRYSPDTNLALSIKHTLEIDKSEERKKRLVKLLGQKLKFEPRRRKDIDLLFLVATPATARQVKPALAFYFASEVPVYATSHLYNGQPNAKRDQDLNGINFCDIPWYLETPPLLKQQIDTAWQSDIRRYGRLFAMGSDALQIAGRLRMISLLPGSKVYGATGTLSMQTNGRIQRELEWARFEDGIPVTRHHIQQEAIGQDTSGQNTIP